MKFSELKLAEPLLERLSQASISEPTPIQELVIPAALRGGDLLAISPTGSGKSLAYLLPLLHRIAACDDRSRSTTAIVLTPTRELAQQVGALCAHYGEALSVSCTVIVGGIDYAPQREALAANPDVVVATPGRLIDLLDQGATSLDSLSYFILDEVDQMVDLGFRDPIVRLSTLRSSSAQTLCLSATLPQGVQSVVETIAPSIELLRPADNPLSVATIEHFGYYVSFQMMDQLLLHLLHVESPTRAIIFTRSRKMADRVVGMLAENSIVAEAMHSDRSQVAREHILDRFRTSQTTILVATDIVARGIDVEGVTHIFNFGLPQSPEQYIHRVGRSGRAGEQGRAISLFTPEERPMLDAICSLMKRHMTLDPSHPYMTQEVSQALAPITKRKKRRK